MCQADTSYQGAAGRWVHVIKHKPHVGNNGSTAPITAAEKAKALFPATMNEVHQQMNYSKVLTPHGGFASIFPCETLYCGGKKTRDASADVVAKTVSAVADTTRAISAGTNLTTCKRFLGNAYSYKYYDTNFWISLDTGASIAMGCPNKYVVCNDCAHTIQQSPCTSPDADPKDVTVACTCGAPIHLLGLEVLMAQKGLLFDSIVLKVNSPTSLQHNVSRSKGNSAPPDFAFAIANLPPTDNAEMEVETFLELRLPDVSCEARHNRDKKIVTLNFDTAADAIQCRDFLSGLSAVNLDLFSDIFMQGQPGALEILGVTGAKRALSLPSPTKPASDTALTPHCDDEALLKKAKFEFDHDGISNIGSSSTAGLVHVKTEPTARLPPPPAPPATTVDNPVVICDLLFALDTVVVVPGRPSRPLSPRRLPLSLKVHPDLEKIAPEAFKQMRVLHLKHLDALIEHEVMWSFSCASKYFPPWFLTMYIMETKPKTLLLGTPREAKPLGVLPTHLHDVCWAKSSYNSKQLCREAWDYVIGKGIKLKEKYSDVAPELWPKHTVVDPSTNIPIRGPNRQLPWIVTRPLPFIEGIYDASVRHPDLPSSSFILSIPLKLCHRKVAMFPSPR